MNKIIKQITLFLKIARIFMFICGSFSTLIANYENPTLTPEEKALAFQKIKIFWPILANFLTEQNKLKESSN